MSAENVEIVRRHQADFNRGDMPAFLDALDGEVEWLPITAALEGRAYRGREAVRGWLEELVSDWELFELLPEAHHDLGDRVLVLGRWRARGRASGVVLENQAAAWLYEVREGKVVWMRTFTERSEALRAAGLSQTDL